MAHDSNRPIIPNDYVIRQTPDEAPGQRTVTVRKYTTDVDYDREAISRAIESSRLIFGDEFGVIEVYDNDDVLKDHPYPDDEEMHRDKRILAGLVGEKNLVLLNSQTSRPDFVKIRNVLVATLMAEFSENPETGKLDLLIYGGKQGHPELRKMLEANFGVNKLMPRVFSDLAIRELCEKRFDRLYQIVIDPLHKDGWGTIKDADFKSSRGQFIDPDADRMKQVRDNKDIVILAFKSVLHNQTREPLEDFYDIKFFVLKDRGISITIPELKLPPNHPDFDYETILYDFVRHAYGRIVGDQILYEDAPDDDDFFQQLSLFDDSDT